jgi:hypothetical protein
MFLVPRRLVRIEWIITGSPVGGVKSGIKLPKSADIIVLTSSA